MGVDVKGRLITTMLAVLLGGHGSASANDTAAAYAAGGLVFQRTDAIRMETEILRISRAKIDVDYVFENTTKSDVTTTIAFPLPDVNVADLAHVPVNLPKPDAPNFVGFRVWVDDKEIHPKMEARAFLSDGREITDTLRDLKIDVLSDGLDDDDASRKLVAMGAAAKESDRVIFGWWTAKVTFHWSQTFPAGARVRVRHTYRPVVGSAYRLAMDGGEWCIDSTFQAAYERIHATYQGVPQFDENPVGQWVKYILKTGANWAGPIGKFTLVIEKTDADLISTCPIPGLKLARSGNTFTATTTNFVPNSDLNILFAKANCSATVKCFED